MRAMLRGGLQESEFFHTPRKGALLQPPPLQELAFSLAPSFWYLQGVSADLQGRPHTMNELAKVFLPPFDIRKSSFSLYTQNVKARNCSFMNLLTRKQFMLKGPGLLLWHSPQKPLLFKISTKQNKNPTNTLDSERMCFFPINSQWGILICEHNYHDYSDLWSHCILLLSCGTGFLYLGRRANDIRNLM